MRVLVQSKVILVNTAGDILLLKRSASDDRRPHEWDLPGGGVDAYEAPTQAAVRELREEAGIVLKESDLKLVYAMTEQPADDISATWLFYAASTVATDVMLSQEHEDSQWVTIGQALDMIAYERQKRALRYIEENRLLGD